MEVTRFHIYQLFVFIFCRQRLWLLSDRDHFENRLHCAFKKHPIHELYNEKNKLEAEQWAHVVIVKGQKSVRYVTQSQIPAT